MDKESNRKENSLYLVVNFLGNIKNQNNSSSSSMHDFESAIYHPFGGTISLILGNPIPMIFKSVFVEFNGNEIFGWSIWPARYELYIV